MLSLFKVGAIICIRYLFFSLICIYCEKTFKDRTVLKEHMRKKFHKCINPNNKAYDKFYIINYLEPGRTWKQRQVLRCKIYMFSSLMLFML